MELKNKLLIVFSIFLVIISLFTSTFASSGHTFVYNNAVYSLSENYDNFDYVFIYYCETYETFNIAVSEEPFLVTLDDEGEFTGFHSPNSEVNQDYDLYLSVPRNGFSSLDSLCNSSIDDLSITHNQYGFSGVSVPNNIYSTFNIYVYDESSSDLKGDLLFQGAPVTVEPMEMKQVEEILPGMWEIIRTILPVCLVIFGVLLVLFLIKSKNLLHL